MSGNFFGDDDDFELTPGGDDSVSVAPKRQNTERPARPVVSQQRPSGAPTLPSPAPVRNTLPRRPRPATTTSTPVTTPAPVAPARQSGIPSRTPRVQTPAPVPVVEEPVAVPQPEPKAPEPVRVQQAPPAPVYEEPYVPPAAVETHENFTTYEPETGYAASPSYEEVPEPRYEAPVRQEPARYEAPMRQEPVRNQPRTISQARKETQDSGFASSQYPEQNSSDPMDERINSRRTFKESFGEHEDDEAKEVKGKSSRSSKSRKGSSAAKSRATKKDGPGKFAGGRKSVLITRVVASAVVLGLMGTGINSIVNPPNIPTPASVTKVVRADLNITKFPAEAGYAFVSAFTKEYLTFSPDQRSQKSDALKMFTTDSLASSLTGASGPELSQKVLEGPVVSGTKSIDDNNAIYTVGAKVESGWVYLDIPVYFDPALNSFSISGTPAFVAPPVKPEKLPAVVAPYSNDTQLVSTIEGDISSFFKVWSESNLGEIDRYINKELADVETKTGLQKTVLFVEVSQLQVEKKTEEAPEFDTRRAQAKVVWANPAAPKITYEQNYDLVLKLGEQNRWYVADITGGVRATGSGA